MRLLLAGAGGQLGRALQASAPADTTVVALARADCDIRDEAAVAAAMARFRPDVLVNAAAYTAVDRAEQEPETAHAINGRAAGLLAAQAAAAGARLVHVSTDFVFDGAASSPYPVDAAPAPLGVYGASKLEGERLVARHHPAPTIVRTAWVHAAEGKNFVRTMLRLMAERDSVRVVADQVGTPTHADSLARAIWALLAAGATGTFHWTDAGVASWYDFAVAIQEEALAIGLIGRAVPVIPIRSSDYPTAARRPAYSVLDKSGCWAITGPAAHWRAELRQCLAGIREKTS